MNKLPIEDIKRRVSKSPCIYGGASFETHILFQKDTQLFTIKPTTGFALFCGIFALPPIIMIAFGIKTYLETTNFQFLAENLGLILAGAIFAAVTGVMLVDFFKRIYFDKRNNRFYKFKFRDKVETELSRIVAIQVIGEIVKSKKNRFNSFELNLVLDDASRINVMDHGNLKGILDDATLLSEFLEIPIWHAES